MRKWVMGLGVAFFAVSALSSAAIAETKKPYTSTTITESGVRSVCGGDLQSGGGAIGCTKQCGQSTCDYSCGGKEGKGCRTIVFTRAAPTGDRFITGTRISVKGTGDIAKPKAASVTAGPPKAGLVSDTGGSASLKTNSKTKSLTTDKTTTTTPVPTTGVSR